MLAILEEGAVAAPSKPSAPKAGATAAKSAAAAPVARAAAETAKPKDDGSAAKLSPSVRRMVEENRLNPTQIAGSGRDGRITKSDVVNYMGTDAC